MQQATGSASASRDPRIDMVKAFAAAFALDATARAAGRADREAGRPFNPGHHEMLAYSTGFGEAKPPRR